VSAFLNELGTKLADKWLSLLVLPGLLLLTTATAGAALGHAGWADAAELVQKAGRASMAVEAKGTVAAVAAAAGVLLASAALGLAATAAGKAVQWLWLGEARLTRPLVERRRHRWRRAHEAYKAEVQRLYHHYHPKDAAPPDPFTDANEPVDPDGGDREELDRLAAQRNRIALAEPRRATWIGDRLAALDRRVLAHYGLDLSSAWPRLWLIVPDTARTELRTAASAFDAAATLGGWGALYLLTGLLWWPAAVTGLVVCTTAWYRGRATMATLTELAEAAVDLYGRDLAAALGLPAAGALTADVGRDVTSRLRKHA
jgi:hypothetical protein